MFNSSKKTFLMILYQFTKLAGKLIKKFVSTSNQIARSPPLHSRYNRFAVNHEACSNITAKLLIDYQPSGKNYLTKEVFKNVIPTFR